MKLVTAALLVLAVPTLVLAQVPKTEDDKTMYALGAYVSGNYKPFGLTEKQIGQVQKGMTDALTGKKPSVDMQKVMPKLQEYIIAYSEPHPGSPGAKDPKAATSKAKPKANDEMLYALGTMGASRLKELSLSPEQVKMMEKGMADTLLGKKQAVDPAAYEGKVQEFARARATAAAEVRKTQEGKAAAEYASKPGAQKSASGMVYIPVRAGTGASPQATDKVKVNYEGKLMDGTVFDSSYKRGQPIEFPLNGVIPCWTEGVQKMKVGGEATLVCPPAIAYGDRGMPPTIPGGSTLVFKVELLGVTPAGATTPAPK